MSNIESPTIAYLIHAHNNPDHVARTVHKLDSPNVSFVVHIDKKANIDPFASRLKSNKRVIFLKNRYPVFWGGYSSVKAILALMRASLSKNAKYYVLLSGSDYPIKNNADIFEFLSGSTREHIHFFKLAEQPNWLEKVRYYYYLDSNWLHPRSNSLWGKKYYHKINRAQARLDINRKLPSNIVPYGGSAWWMLTHDCVEYVLDFVKTQSAFTRFYSLPHSPDEMVFQTIILNSRFRDQVANYQQWEAHSNREAVYAQMTPSHPLHFRKFNSRYIDFTKSTQSLPGSPKFLDETDFGDIRSSHCLFARKFDPVHSSTLLEIIDREIL